MPCTGMMPLAARHPPSPGACRPPWSSYPPRGGCAPCGRSSRGVSGRGAARWVGDGDLVQPSIDEPATQRVGLRLVGLPGVVTDLAARLVEPALAPFGDGRREGSGPTRSPMRRFVEPARSPSAKRRFSSRTVSAATASSFSGMMMRLRSRWPSGALAEPKTHTRPRHGRHRSAHRPPSISSIARARTDRSHGSSAPCSRIPSMSAVTSIDVARRRSKGSVPLVRPDARRRRMPQGRPRPREISQR